eukprot:scpid15012/ scgid3377/ Thyroid receptor-interacting protein 11; Clonal evolution-related gene on chromosome 14 protein; Golgi-associated microtubule-binding protein 210; Trip230
MSSWLSSNLSSSFSEFTSQISSLAGDVIPNGIAPQKEEAEQTDSVPQASENGVDGAEVKRDGFSLPVAEVEKPVETPSGFQDVTFSPIKDESQRRSIDDALTSTPNSSRGSFSEFLGETGSFVGDAASFVGAGGDSSAFTAAKEPSPSAVHFGHDQSDGAALNGAQHDTLPESPSNAGVETPKATVETKEDELALLQTRHEEELRSLRESHKLKIQALHEHQQADMEEMEQRIAELESQRQQSMEQLSEQQQQANAANSSSHSKLATLQDSVGELTEKLEKATIQVDKSQASVLSLESEIQERDRLIASLQESAAATVECTGCAGLRRDLDDALLQRQKLEEASKAEKVRLEHGDAERNESEMRQAAALATLSEEHDKLLATLEECQKQLAQEKQLSEEFSSAAEESARVSNLLASEQERSLALAKASAEHEKHAGALDAELNTLQATLQEFKTRESTITQEMEELRKASVSSSHEYSKLQDEHEQLSAAHSSLKQQMSTEQSASESARSASVSLVRFEEVNANLTQCQQRLAKADGELAAMKENHAVEIQQQLDTIASLQAESLRSQEELNSQLSSEQVRNASLTQRASDMESALGAKSAEVETLCLQQETLRARETSLSEQLDSTMTATKEMSEKHARLVADHEELALTHSTLQQEVLSDRNTLEVLRQSSVDTTVLTQVQAELAHCKQQLVDTQQELESAQTFRDSKEQCGVLEERVRDLQSQLATKDTDLSGMQSQVDQCKTQESHYVQQLEVCRTAAQHAEEEHSKLLADHQQLSTSYSQLQNDLSAERSAAESARSTLVSCSELEAVRHQAALYQQQLAQSLDELATLKETSSLQIKQHEHAMANERARSQTAEAEFNSKLSAALEKSNRLEQTVQDVEHRISSKDDQLQALQLTLDQYSTQQSQLVQEREQHAHTAQQALEKHAKLTEEHKQLRSAHAAAQDALAQERSTAETVRSSSVDLGMFEDVQSNVKHYQELLAQTEKQLATLKESHQRVVESHSQTIAEERAQQEKSREEFSTQLSSAQNQTERVAVERDDLQAQLTKANEMYSQLRDGSMTPEEQERQQRESDRLRQHLLMVEEQHTQDLLDAEKVQEDLREELRAAQQATDTRALSAESDISQCHQDIQLLEQKVSRLSEERNLAMQQAMDAETTAESSSSSLARLQLVLEQFQKERDEHVASALEPLEAKLQSCHDEIDDYKSQLAQLQVRLDEMSALRTRLQTTADSLATKRSELEGVRITLQDSQTALDVSQEKLHRLAAAAEGKVDINLVRNLLLTYLTASAEKRHEVLRPVASILGFSGNEMAKVAKQQSSWLGSWLRADGKPSGTAVPSDKTFTELFVEFLEAESTPAANAAAPHEISAAAIKDGHISTSRLPASAFANSSLPLSSDRTDQQSSLHLSLTNAATPPAESPSMTSAAAAAVTQHTTQMPIASAPAVPPLPIDSQVQFPESSTTTSTAAPAAADSSVNLAKPPIAGTPSTTPTSQTDALRTILNPSP